jgi:hypothetical protein
MNQPVRVVLGSNYAPTMWDLRKRVSMARRGGEPVTFIQVGAPINSEIVEIAILSGSLYLIGVRSRDGTWFEFVPDDARGDPTQTGTPKPRLPGSRWIQVGSLPALSSYRALRLPWMLRDQPGATGVVAFADTPLELVRFFRQWDGSLSVHNARLNICVLIFLICEALRFRSIENICARYIWPIGGMPSDPIARPIFSITEEMFATVQNWYTRARSGDPDVWTWPRDMPDRLVS